MCVGRIGDRKNVYRALEPAGGVRAGVMETLHLIRVGADCS